MTALTSTPAPASALDRLMRHARIDESGVVRLGPRTIYILPTRYGLLFALLVAALVIAAFNYSNNLVFGLCFLLAGIGLVAMLQTWRNLVGLEIEIHDPKPVFAGQAARFPVYMRRTSPAAGIALDLRMEDGVPAHLDLSAVSAAGAFCALTARSRGLLAPRRLVIESRFPLGLLRAWSVVIPAARALIYPAPLTGVPRVHHAAGQGDSDSVTVEGDDFAGLRLYRQGEPLHHVSWKVMARTGELHTKVFTGEGPERGRIAWDDAPGGDTETRLSILTAWVLEATRQGESFSFHLPGIEFGADQGQAHCERCLRALALHGLDP